MTDVAALKTLINNQLNRGTIYDAVLDSYIIMAAKFLEKNSNLSYMKRYMTSAGTADVRTLAVPTAFVKRIEMLRYATTSGVYNNVAQVAPRQITENAAGDPHYFWFDGRTTIYFDNTPDRAITFEFELIEFTDWSSMTDSTTNWLLEYGQDALLWKTLEYLSSADENAMQFQLAKANFGEALAVLLGAEEEFVASVRDSRSHYQGES